MVARQLACVSATPDCVPPLGASGEQRRVITPRQLHVSARQSNHPATRARGGSPPGPKKPRLRRQLRISQKEMSRGSGVSEKGAVAKVLGRGPSLEQPAPRSAVPSKVLRRSSAESGQGLSLEVSMPLPVQKRRSAHLLVGAHLAIQAGELSPLSACFSSAFKCISCHSRAV